MPDWPRRHSETVNFITIKIFLDLNLPKKDDKLKRITLVILTTSNAEEDILKTYDLHANCYITKPIDLD